MKPLLKRRTVYAATLVGMLVVISGFTFAAGLFGGFTSTTVHGNQSSITAGTTIYGKGVTNTLFWNAAGAVTCDQPTATPPQAGNKTFETVYLSGAAGACGAGPDYMMQINFTSNNTLSDATTYTDTFVVSSEFTTSSGGSPTGYTTSSATIACAVPTTTSPSTNNICEVVINIDTGILTSEAQPSVIAIGVTVTGS